MRCVAWSVVLGLATAGCHHPSSASTAATNHATAAPDAADGAASSNTERVSFRTRDGWTIVGDLSRGTTAVPVLLVHQLSSNRREWAPLLARLHADPSLTTLAIDLRGHGESTRGPDGTTTWQSFGSDPARWSGIVRDVEAAVQFLQEQYADLRGVVAVGSSIGSTAIVREAADDPRIDALVTISPGLDYHELDTVQPLTRFLARGRPVFAIASQGDTASVEAVRRFEALDSPNARDALDGGAAFAMGIDASASGADARPARSLVRTEIVAGTGAHGVSIGAPGVHPQLWADLDHWIRDAIREASAAPQP